MTWGAAGTALPNGGSLTVPPVGKVTSPLLNAGDSQEKVSLACHVWAVRGAL